MKTKVVYDGKGEFKQGDKVLLIPNTPVAEDEFIKENYLRSSKFRASEFDGFMQEYVKRWSGTGYFLAGIQPEIAAISELISVSMHTIEKFMEISHSRRENRRLGRRKSGIHNSALAHEVSA